MEATAVWNLVGPVCVWKNLSIFGGIDWTEFADSTGIYVFDFRTTNCTNDTNFCGCSFVKFVSFVVAYPSNHACIGQNIENGRVSEFQLT